MRFSEKFLAARPAWPAGRAREMNLFVGFRAIIGSKRTAGPVLLRLTASSLYRAFVNGEFIGHGPVPSPHGYSRVDEWGIGAHLRAGRNVVAVEVAGYNVNGFYTLDMPSFLQAEVVDGDGRVLAATGAPQRGFRAKLLDQRVQKVQRYTFQRAFSEVYRLAPDSDRWRVDPAAPMETVACARQPQNRVLPRLIPYPAFERIPAARLVGRGRVRKHSNAPVVQLRDIAGFDDFVKRWPDNELEVVPFVEMQTYRNVGAVKLNRPVTSAEEFKLSAGDYRILDFGRDLSGFIGARIACRRTARLFFLFDELLSDGDVNFRRDTDVVNILAYDVRPGTYSVESFEPYTLRYLKIVVLDGECAIRGAYLREFANPDATRARLVATDRHVKVLFEAARETYRQNAADLFTDCPGRERGGWLCDSYFTSRTAFALSGNTASEKYFLQNFLLPRSFPGLPPGMLPMVYPGDPWAEFIPNWALWFVLQLEEYARRSGDAEMVGKFRSRVMKLLRYFERFRNADGLLEGLESWVFVDWSKANSFVQDVNYPTNMIYAGALDAVGRMYGESRFLREATRVRAAVRRQSFDGDFFVDNAVRKEGRLQRTRNRTEACQYYAFYFGVATPKSHPALWRRLLTRFGPLAPASAFPAIHRGGVLVSWMLRLDLLSRFGHSAQVWRETVKYFLPMARLTGTFWEHAHTRASCNHGFASHVAHVLFRDVLGIWDVDPAARVVTVRLADDLPMSRCEGAMPLGREAIRMKWWKRGKRRFYRLEVPAGWRVRRVALGNRHWEEA